MRPFTSRLLLSIATVCGCLVTDARAGVTSPGSLLVFPSWDNTPGTLTLLTVTNTNKDQLAGSVDVEFVYVDGFTCQEFNRTRTLTPADELTVATFIDNPSTSMGYVYCFAKSHTTGQAIKFDWLIGSSLTLTGSIATAYETPPFVFKAGAALADGAPTDINNDGIRQFNGIEYELLPDQLEFPSFAGVNAQFSDELILINLTGGQQFNTLVDFLVWNDNEQVFSVQYEFTCWVRVLLANISPLFTDVFLKTTNDSPTEIAGVPAAPDFGWFQIDGNVSQSSGAVFPDPAILAVRKISFKNGVLIPNPGNPVNTRSVCVALPFGLGTQSNGALLSHTLLGN
jgi:hypothetical protein